MVAYLGWDNCVYHVPPPCPVIWPGQPNFQLPKQNRSGCGMTKMSVNPTHLGDHQSHPVCVPPLSFISLSRVMSAAYSDCYSFGLFYVMKKGRDKWLSFPVQSRLLNLDKGLCPQATIQSPRSRRSVVALPRPPWPHFSQNLQGDPSFVP